MTNTATKKPITLYVVPGCPLCEHARHWLEQMNLKYVERDVAGNFGALRAMYQLTHQRLVPVFEIDGQAFVRPTDEELKSLLL